MKLNIVKGKTSKSVDIFIRDSSATTGVGLTGLAYNTAGLTAYYHRAGSAAAAITLATLASATAAWSSGGFVAVDGTNMPGVYRLDIPDACLATGVDEVVIMLKGATNMEPVLLEIQLTSVDPNDAVRGGMTALPNANAGAAGGLMTCSSANVLNTDAIAAASIAAAAATKVADATLARDLSAVSSPASRSLLNAARILRNKHTVAGGTLTVYQEDDSTSAWTGAVTSDPSANPITGIDPA
jgi:hypothetical protein